MLSIRNSPQTQGQKQAESERLEKDISCKQQPEKSRSSYINIKVDFKSKTIKRDKEEIKGSIHQESITIINIYAPSQSASKLMRQTLRTLKGALQADRRRQERKVWRRVQKCRLSEEQNERQGLNKT